MKKLRLLSIAALLVSSSVVTANDEAMEEMMQGQDGFDMASLLADMSDAAPEGNLFDQVEEAIDESTDTSEMNQVFGMLHAEVVNDIPVLNDFAKEAAEELGSLDQEVLDKMRAVRTGVQNVASQIQVLQQQATRRMQESARLWKEKLATLEQNYMKEVSALGAIEQMVETRMLAKKEAARVAAATAQQAASHAANQDMQQDMQQGVQGQMQQGVQGQMQQGVQGQMQHVMPQQVHTANSHWKAPIVEGSEQTGDNGGFVPPMPMGNQQAVNAQVMQGQQQNDFQAQMDAVKAKAEEVRNRAMQAANGQGMNANPMQGTGQQGVQQVRGLAQGARASQR